MACDGAWGPGPREQGRRGEKGEWDALGLGSSMAQPWRRGAACRRAATVVCGHGRVELAERHTMLREDTNCFGENDGRGGEVLTKQWPGEEELGDGLSAMAVNGATRKKAGSVAEGLEALWETWECFVELWRECVHSQLKKDGENGVDCTRV